jgi:hypothetical protein
MEAIISPGVFFNENDLTQIEQGPITVGAAIIGPTVRGPVNKPTLVTSYNDFKSIFGATFQTGSATEEYLTSLAIYNYFQQGGSTLLVTRAASGSYTSATASVAATVGVSFVLETIGEGVIMNNDADADTAVNGKLPAGNVNNVKWEIISSDPTNSGLFNLIVRRGDDDNTSKSVLETWTNLSLDPNSNNFIEFVIGTQYTVPVLDDDGNYQLQQIGRYPNNSRFIRVKEGFTQARPAYNNESSEDQDAMPVVGTGPLNGAFGSATGELYGGFGSFALNMFENIPNSTSNQTNNIQGLVPANYDTAISLLRNKDWYIFDTIYAPGLNKNNALQQVTDIINLAETRGDTLFVVDMVATGSAASTVVGVAQNLNTSYAATYWPWVTLRSNETGRLLLVPASTVIPGAYAYNDRVGAEWFAPAGLNRGVLSTAIAPETRLSRASRDTLYNGKVNPIALFPGAGTVIYGQKTLQKKATALDRVNVRRLLISLKRYIGQIAETLVFEQNTAVTRNRFINIVTPYMTSVQQRQGIYSFRIVMDETNNTPDVIDRNTLVGAIYLQPTRTAEFIVIDFNLTPTGASFGE